VGLSLGRLLPSFIVEWRTSRHGQPALFCSRRSQFLYGVVLFQKFRYKKNIDPAPYLTHPTKRGTATTLGKSAVAPEVRDGCLFSLQERQVD
jgi:hypothetical protein